MPPPTTTLTLGTLPPDIILQRGDNDAKGTWGGKKRPGMGGEPVRELQRALVAIGAMSANPDGDFGGKTQDGVRRLQWYLGAMAWRLRVPPDSDPLHGTLETYTQPAGVQVDGFVRPATMAELLALWQGGYELTSPLVAMSITGLSNVETAGTFTVLAYPSSAAGEVLVHQDFVASLRVMNTKATDAKVTLRINQAFRVQGVAVNGAVVPPASSSQHLIGNAVDLNIVDGSTVNTSAMFLAGTQTQAAKDFVKAVKDVGLRWGGDFSPKDPPHFDRYIVHTGPDYKNAYYFAQRSYARQHPLRKV